MMSFVVIAVLSALAVLVVGTIQSRRTGRSRRKWASPLAAFGLVLMAVGTVMFQGMESLYIWAAGIALFFVGFFVERIADIRQELNRTEDVEL